MSPLCSPQSRPNHSPGNPLEQPLSIPTYTPHLPTESPCKPIPGCVGMVVLCHCTRFIGLAICCPVANLPLRPVHTVAQEARLGIASESQRSFVAVDLVGLA